VYVNINLTTKDFAGFNISGSNDDVDSAHKSSFIGAIPSSINLAVEQLPGISSDDFGMLDMQGSAIGNILMNNVINTLCLSPLMLRSMLPRVEIEYKGSKKEWGKFACNLFTVDSKFQGSTSRGAVLDDIRNYVFYNNLKTPEHLMKGLGGCVTEDFFLYRQEVIPEQSRNQRVTEQHTQRGQKTIQQVFPTETDKKLIGIRAMHFADTVGRALKQIGIGDFKVANRTDDSGKPYQELLVELSYDYANSKGLTSYGTTESGIEIPISMLDSIYYELMHLCSDITKYKTHIPIVLINYADYAQTLPSQVIPVLKAFNTFIKRISNGIVIYFNVDTSVPKFYDAIMNIERVQ